MDSIAPRDAGSKRLFAAGGLIGALLASTCCIAPLVLLTLGVSGAWMGNLTALAPYQGYFITASLLFLAAGYWYVYFKPRRACAEGSYCASARSDRFIKLVLWVSTLLIILSLAVNLIVPLFL